MFKILDSMKTKTTQKAIKNRYEKVVRIGYCDLQFLLYHESPAYYTTRVEGWGSDIYIFDDIAISTGYKPFGNIKPKYEFLKKYDEEARKIVEDWDTTYETKNEKLNELIKKFLSEVEKA